MATIKILEHLDSPEMAAQRRVELDIPSERARLLGLSAVAASKAGYYLSNDGVRIDWSASVAEACSSKLSIGPDAPLPASERQQFEETKVQVSNETTLQASYRLFEKFLHPIALNFANGIRPGGGFLNGARAQEEVLCRSSALHATLVDDAMYEFHRKRPRPDSSDWVIYSPRVPIFRTDDGLELERPWPLSFLTSAAPVAHSIGQSESGDLLRQRIYRVLAVASALGYETLVLGAWGCGAFGNDPHRTALDFRSALESEFSGCFSDIVFAIADWSPERKFLGPFRDVFGSS